MKKIMLITSGSGALIEKCLDFEFFRKSLHIIASDKSCKAEEVAVKNNINYINLQETDAKRLNAKLLKTATDNGIDFIISCSYTRKVSGEIFDIYRNKLFNSHFSILPAFKGFYDTRDTDRSIPARNIFERMINYGSRIMGNTIHVLTEEIDAGAPIIVSYDNIPYGEEPARTRHRLFIQEGKCLLQMVDWLQNDRIQFVNDKPMIKDATFQELGFSPNIDNPEISKLVIPFPNGPTASPAE